MWEIYISICLQEYLYKNDYHSSNNDEPTIGEVGARSPFLQKKQYILRRPF